MLSNTLPGKAKTRRDASAEYEENVYFSVVRSEVYIDFLDCIKCPCLLCRCCGVTTAP